MSFPLWGRLCSAVVAALALSWGSVASADVRVYSETLTHVESASRHAEEKLSAGKPIDVDLFTGTASLSIRDVHVPGNGSSRCTRSSRRRAHRKSWFLPPPAKRFPAPAGA